MPPFEQITADGEFESSEIDEGLEEIQQSAVSESTPTERQNTFSLSHKHPELYTVMTNAEILNYSNRELTADAIDASFLRAQQEYVSHFAPQINSLPDEVKDALLKSLNLDSKYEPNFPLFAQVLKSSYA
ncbi:MAG: hypothetical protein IT342_05715 [Candidatus Melainabacteria bacterium]|nr:hypothetical protein [Candidatus Melainabacteria bacterium]